MHLTPKHTLFSLLFASILWVGGPALAQYEVPLGALERVENYSPKPLPDIPFFDREGKEVLLQSFKGKAVVLNFWATWCKPCVIEMPDLDKLQKQMRKEGVVVVAVSEDFKGIEPVEKFYERNGLKNLIPYTDEKNKLMGEMGVRGLPTSIFINAKGQEVARVDGIIDWDDKEIRDFIRGLK